MSKKRIDHRSFENGWLSFRATILKDYPNDIIDAMNFKDLFYLGAVCLATALSNNGDSDERMNEIIAEINAYRCGEALISIMNPPDIVTLGRTEH